VGSEAACGAPVWGLGRVGGEEVVVDDAEMVSGEGGVRRSGRRRLRGSERGGPCHHQNLDRFVTTGRWYELSKWVYGWSHKRQRIDGPCPIQPHGFDPGGGPWHIAVP
jgi:hypothetical protein